jgi:hypothetical protein
MKTLKLFGLLLFLSASFSAQAVTCFKTGERMSGMNKICYYDCLGSEAAITVSSYQLCPLSIQRRENTLAELIGIDSENSQFEEYLVTNIDEYF